MFKEILQSIKKLYDQGLLKDAVYEDPFILSNKNAFLFITYPDIPIKSYEQFEKYGYDSIYPLPIIKGTEGMTIYIGDEFAISSNSKEKAAAFEFIKILLSDDIQNSKFLLYESVLSDLSNETISRIMGYSPGYDLGKDFYFNYNNERYTYYSKINRGIRGIDIPGIKDILIEHTTRFFRGEATIDEVIKDMQYDADHFSSKNH